PKCKELQELMAQAVTKEGSEQQDIWNQCFDLIAEYAPLYPVVHKQVNTAYYEDKIADFKGIGTTGVYAVGAKAK
ncbi:MAG: ABC transporter substrate-binding protein, partial [Atopobium minutum]|nr:ABC transporter substrate-binding protein [Atopobium minutum]